MRYSLNATKMSKPIYSKRFINLLFPSHPRVLRYSLSSQSSSSRYQTRSPRSRPQPRHPTPHRGLSIVDSISKGNMSFPQAYDSMIISSIFLFGVVHFVIMANHTIITYPTNTVSLLLYCSGVIVWCASSLFSRIMFSVRGHHTGYGKRAQYLGVLFLIWGCTCSTICLLFPVQPLLRTSYLITSTFIFTSSTTNIFGSSLDTLALDISFPYVCARFGLLCCVPALHDLVTRGENVGLAAEFLYMSVRNTLGAGMYMICSCNPMDWRVLPRIGQIIMYFILLQSIIMFAEVILSSGEGQKRSS